MTAEVLNEDGLSFLGTDSFISDTSIASYKTERSINSRKSRYNALPRRKYADIGQPSLPPGLVSEDVDELSVPKVCRLIVHLATTTLSFPSRARMIPILNLPVHREGGTRLLVPLCRKMSTRFQLQRYAKLIGRLATTTSASLSRARMMPILNLPVQREGRTRLLVPYLVLRTPKSISSPRRGDRPVGCLWSSHHNWKVLSVPVHPTKHLLHPLKRSRLHPPMVLCRILPRRNVISKVRHL